MAPAWGVECDLWNGNPWALGETTSVGQVVTLARLVRKVRSLQSLPVQREEAAAGCGWCTRCVPHAVSSDASSQGGKREHQQLLWKTLFLGHIRWGEKRRNGRNPRSPDFRLRCTGDAMLLNSCCKPAWVDAQLAPLDAQADPPGCVPAASLWPNHADELVGPGYENRLTPESVKKLCKQGQVKEAVEVLEILVETSFGVDNYLLYYVLKECVARKHMMVGGQVHALAVKMGFGSDKFLCTHLIRMYAAHGKLQEAMDVFKGVALPDAFTWSAIISAHAKQGQARRAIELYQQMRTTRTRPDNYVFVAALQACAAAGDLRSGRQVHSEIEEHGLKPDVAVGNSLVNMYAKCGSLRDARMMFDGLCQKDVVTWSAMIAGYAHQEGMGQDALNLYSAMRDEGMVVPNVVTFVCLLQACASMGVSALEKGKQLHSEVKERGLQSDGAVGVGLVNMYAKCGGLRDARIVFDGLREKSVVTWNAMITGYAQQEDMGQEALSLYRSMRNEGMVVPDAVTFVCLLQACASVAALQLGEVLHSEIREEGLESDALIGTCLVNMYAQCGRLEISRQVFDRLAMRSVESWTALINGYAEHGEGGMAIQCFEELLELGIQPNDVTYICLLTACSRAGLVVEGQHYFDAMEERHGIKPDERHYSCMVDLFGRSGHLGRAEQMLLGTQCLAGNAVSWRALLSACKSYGDAELGRRCFEHLVKLEPTVAAAYVLLGSIYANAGKWNEVEKVETLRKAAGARKKAAVACIEVKKEVHKFTVGEERSDIAGTLRKMNRRVKEGGHVPQTQLVLRANVSEQQKEDALCGHAEKLALAYGLLNTPAGSTLLVTKNLRMCNDCHSSTKIMSRVEKRDIMVRDGHKVHRFQNGACSCQDRP